MKRPFNILKKEKALFHLFISVMLLLLLSGCKKSDWFDAKSNTNVSVPSTLKDFEYLLDNYEVITIGSPALGEIGSDGHYIPESRWINTYELNIPYSNMQRNAYTWTNNVLYTEVFDWNQNYKKIFQCNLVLTGLQKIKPSGAGEQEYYNQIKGNALFHRAKGFYDVAQVYAQPYKASSASTDLGIPLKEGIDVTESTVRASVKQTYDQVIADLLIASELLPVTPQLHTRGSKKACLALLARVYLTMGDYGKAGIYSDAVLKLYHTLMDFNSIPATDATLGLFNAEVIFHSVMAQLSAAFVPGDIFIDPDLYALYDDNDLRKSRFFIQDATGITFKGMYNDNIGQFTGLATDEMYLIRAESYARQGNSILAMKDLNDLLRTRWTKDSNGSTLYIDQIAVDATDALRKIIVERKKELLLRGLRWTDLRRLNTDDHFKITITRTIGGNTYILEPDSYKYTLPIPDDEIGLSPKMVQAPGWKR